jgi:hypothetical protein
MALALTTTQLEMLMAAAQPLPLHKRGEFLRLFEEAVSVRDCDVQCACETAVLAVLEPTESTH